MPRAFFIWSITYELTEFSSDSYMFFISGVFLLCVLGYYSHFLHKWVY